jgi:transformation/transcription domain-associated protein
MGEEDLLASLWQGKKAQYEETRIALAYAQQGCFELAQGALELAQNKMKNDFANNSAPPALNAEFKLIEDEWIRYSKELNEWDMLVEFASTSSFDVDPWIALEGAWKSTPPNFNWELIKEATAKVEVNNPPKMDWKVKAFTSLLNFLPF